MGIDKEGLDQQIREKKDRVLAEKRADQDQAAYDQQVFRILTANEEARRAEKMESMKQLQSDLVAHSRLPKNTCDKMGDTVDAEACGFSAAQYFSGEDKNGEERRRLQQAQMRQWTTQQVAEKAARTAEEGEDAARYDQYLNAVDGMRGEMEKAESDRARDDRMTVRQLNEMRAAEKADLGRAEKERNEFMNDREFEHVKNDPFINEETDVAKSAVADYRVRPDHFKGFSKAQTDYIYKKNGKLVQDNLDTRAGEAAEAAGWAAHTDQVVRMMEAAEQADKDSAKELEMERDTEIQRQREEGRERKEESRRDRFGAVGGGFFDGFGRSCR